MGSRALQQVASLAAMRGVSASQCIRDVIEHFLGGDAGRTSELARIKNILGRSHRGRRA
jgi:hypothetical protein